MSEAFLEPPPVPPIPGAPGKPVNAIKVFMNWLHDNDGVLVTNVGGDTLATCMNCGSNARFASDIKHADNCFYEIAKKFCATQE
jgi:hypothetical protein